MAQVPDMIPEPVLRQAKAELDAESRDGVERLARAGCVVLSWLAGSMLAELEKMTKAKK